MSCGSLAVRPQGRPSILRNVTVYGCLERSLSATFLHLSATCKIWPIEIGFHVKYLGVMSALLSAIIILLSMNQA
jgi:hypothetical protein